MKRLLLTINSYCKQFNVSKSTAKRDLNVLLDNNLIKRKLIGKNSNFYVSENYS